MNQFNIIEYLSGLTSYTFSKSVLETVARNRDVLDIEDYYSLDDQTKELLFADLLFLVYTGANSSASYSVADGAFKESIGSQTINDKKAIYDVMIGIYQKYGDPKIEMVQNSASGLRWINEFD